MKGVKTGGRVVGSQNKVTADLRNTIKKIIEDNIEQVSVDIASLSPKDRVAIIEKLLQYVIPKVQAVEFDATKTISTAAELLRGMAKYDDNP